jgi:MFS family permease
MTAALDERPTRAHWRMATILCLVNAVAFIDRAALPLLVQPIKRDLAISDTEISLLIGLAFILTYALGGSLAGALVDRFSRTKVLASGIGLWGVATMLCGIVSNYAAFFLSRCAIGAGEASCGPASMSLIKDTFGTRFRGRAVAMWAMGAGLGTGAALLTGGTILHLVGETGSLELPIFGVVRGWQLVLMVCGALSFPVALLVLTIREPARVSSQAKMPRLREALASVRDRWAIFVPLFLANAAMMMLANTYLIWVPALFERTWSVSVGQIGLVFGLINITMNTTSNFVAGWLLDVIHKRFGFAAVPMLGVAAYAIIFIPAVLIPQSPSVPVAWLLVACFNLLVAGLFTLGTATVVHLTPSAVTGKITGVHFAWVGITGSGVGPTLVALTADRGFGGGQEALGQAVSCVGGALAVTAGACLLMVSIKMRRAVPGRSAESKITA